MVEGEINRITEQVIKEFGDLLPRQLNWKSSNNRWSIGQCIHHLIVSNGKYIPIFMEIASGKRKMTFWEKHNPLTKYTGNKMVNTLGPVLVKKYKSPLLFTPSGKVFDSSMINEFVNQQHSINELFNELKKDKYSGINLTSPVAGLITLRLSDAMKLIVVHEQRHVQQALSIKSDPAFPV